MFFDSDFCLFWRQKWFIIFGQYLVITTIVIFRLQKCCWKNLHNWSLSSIKSAYQWFSSQKLTLFRNKSLLIAGLWSAGGQKLDHPNHYGQNFPILTKNYWSFFHHEQLKYQSLHMFWLEIVITSVWTTIRWFFICVFNDLDSKIAS